MSIVNTFTVGGILLDGAAGEVSVIQGRLSEPDGTWTFRKFTFQKLTTCIYCASDQT